eukprot:34789-Chlamydomonas_euryale.AAC.2
MHQQLKNAMPRQREHAEGLPEPMSARPAGSSPAQNAGALVGGTDVPSRRMCEGPVPTRFTRSAGCGGAVQARRPTVCTSPFVSSKADLRPIVRPASRQPWALTACAVRPSISEPRCHLRIVPGTGQLAAWA